MRNAKCIQQSAIGLLVGMAVLSCGSADSLAGQSEAASIIRGEGVLTPAGYKEIRCPANQPHPVLFIAEPGQMVKKGDLLVELDAFALMEKDEEQHIRLLKAQAELAAAEASVPGATEVAKGMTVFAEQALRFTERQLADFTTGEYAVQETAARNEVTLAEERFVRLQERLDELEAAYKEQGTKELMRELLEVRLASSQARMELAMAGDKLKVLREIIRPRRTEELELAVSQRKLDLLRAQHELARITQEGQARLEIAKSIREMENGRLQILRRQIELCKYYAPRDGTVFSSNDALLGAPCEPGPQPGDMARPGQVLLRLSDLMQLKLDIRIGLPLAQKLAPGRQATVRVDAFPNRTYRGHVTNIRVLADSDTTHNPTEAMVSIRLDDPVKNFRPGLTATAEFDVRPAPETDEDLL